MASGTSREFLDISWMEYVYIVLQNPSLMHCFVDYIKKSCSIPEGIVIQANLYKL